MSRSQELNILALDGISPVAKIRFTEINGVNYLSVRDFIIIVCRKNQNEASEVWRRLSDSKKFQIQPILMYKFPGQGQSNQPVITFPCALKLAMLLPGKHIQQYRVQVTEIISRYLEGDMSMCDEIKCNSSLGPKRTFSRFANEMMKSTEVSEIKTEPDFQYVYATKSAAFPRLVKIGRTDNMKARLLQLNTGCAPAPHELVAIVPTMNMRRDELLAHEHFASNRKAGEFFQVNEDEVKEYFTNVILKRYQRELFEAMRC